jgi:hypothetical protein
MRLVSAGILWTLATTVGVSPLAGQTSERVGLSSFSFDLDTPEGHFSNWTIDDLNPATHFDAHLVVGALRHNPEWSPLFSVILGDSSEAILLQMASPAKDSPLIARIVHVLQGTPTDGVEIHSPPAPGDTTVLSVDWSTPRQLVMRFNDQRHTFKTQRPLTRITFASSSGQMKSHRIALCRSAAQVATC